VHPDFEAVGRKPLLELERALDVVLRSDRIAAPRGEQTDVEERRRDLAAVGGDALPDRERSKEVVLRN
jgi:hypothetical protein